VKKAIRHFIIAKAREVFQEKGYSCTTMEDIAGAAEISKPTLYHYFSGKESIFRQVVKLSDSEFEEIINPVIQGPDEFPLRLKNLTYEILNHFNKNRGILKIAFHESHMFIEAMDHERKGGIHEFLESKVRTVSKLKEFFQEGIKKGYVRKNIPAELIAVFYSGILSEFSLAYILGKERMANLDLNELVNYITGILSSGVLKI
jgi:AcrR family transcriptional regulator